MYQCRSFLLNKPKGNKKGMLKKDGADLLLIVQKSN